MSQRAMTFYQRQAAVMAMGYTQREAAFLLHAALHSGYFLRRQIARYFGKATGWAATTLIEKTQAKKHTSAAAYAHNVKLYHLATRPFYNSLGQDNNRNRRARQSAPCHIDETLRSVQQWCHQNP